MIEWHHQLNGHKYEQTPGNSEAQRRLAYCSPWGCKESDTPEWINNNNWKSIHVSFLLRRKDAKLSIETGKIIMVIQKKSLIFPEDYQKVIFYSFPKNNSFIVKTEGKKKKQIICIMPRQLFPFLIFSCMKIESAYGECSQSQK